MPSPKNVLGSELESCCTDPLTGFYRTGKCETGPDDLGLHLICAEMTEDFLEFSLAQGNDLITPMPNFHFPGLQPGDRWCLCATRWKEAMKAGLAPPIALEATHISALEFVSLEELQEHALSQE